MIYPVLIECACSLVGEMTGKGGGQRADNRPACWPSEGEVDSSKPQCGSDGKPC